MTKDVKEYAFQCGVDLVGVASVERFEGAPPGFHPTDVMHSTQSVIAFARKFVMGILDELAPGRQRLSYKHHMFAHKNTYNTFTGYDIARYLESKGHKAFVIQPTTPYYAHEFRSPMSHRHAAVRCGLGVFGKNNLVLTKEFGPRQRFCTVLTDAELVPDPMIDENLCKGCNACREACPVQAWDPKSGIFYKAVCAHHQNWNRADQECKQPCGICIQVCPFGKEALGLPKENEMKLEKKSTTTPLWRMLSGKFAGYRVGDRMYGPEGDNIGYFDGRIIYALNGQCIGEVYNNQWIGKRVNVGYRYGGSKDPLKAIHCEPKEDQANPIKIEAWEDPPFFLTGRMGLKKRWWDN